MTTPPLSSCPRYTNHSTIDLLEKSLGSDDEIAWHIKNYAFELGLTQSNGAYSGFNWLVQKCPLHSITYLPPPQRHSGRFEWIGEINQGLPAWLWDSEDGCTVEATPARLQEGYIAVSWTWGRYVRDGTRKTTGTPWLVPNLLQICNKDLLTHLKQLLKTLKVVRYFWVDLLCINQGNEEEKQREISKQAHIFAEAKGSIGFLWSLNSSDLSEALTAFGKLLSWCFSFGRFPPDIEESITSEQTTTPSSAGTTSAHASLEQAFRILRGANWFTSLWALQEIILSPASMWVTADGYCCRVNEELVTTRLFAIAVRLLCLAERCRDLEWQEAEITYLAKQAMSVGQLQKRREQFDSEEYKRGRALRTAFEEQIQPGQAPEFLVVETDKTDAHPPCIITAYHKERLLRNAVQQWTGWAFGTASIDVATWTSRTAILVAGRNRHVVGKQSRELALLAALKIRPHPGFISWHNEQTRQTNLLNVILRKDGVKLFDVAHASPPPTVIHRITATDDADMACWEPIGDVLDFLHIQDEGQVNRDSGKPESETWTTVTLENEQHATSVQYQRNGHSKFVAVLRSGDLLLTSMSPYTADRLNQQSSHFLGHKQTEWEKSDGWHMHDTGCLHIPPGARVQSVVRKGNETKLMFRPNGSSSECYTIEKRSDFKHVWKTQDWLQKMLGTPKFLLLPLGITRPRFQLEYFGIVLVGKEALRKDTSMTVWYKFGTYRGWGVLEALDWKDGILVMAAKDEATMKPQTSEDCIRCEERASNILKTLNEQHVGAEENDFDVIRHDEIYDRISSSGVLIRQEANS